MKKVISISFILALVISCNSLNHSKVAFEVTNQTSEVIDSIIVQPDRMRNHYFSLGPDKSTKVTVDLSGLGDGAFGVTYKIGNQHRSLAFGYFSNGQTSERTHKIIFQTDTVIYKPN